MANYHTSTQVQFGGLRCSLEGSGPGWIRSAWDQGVKWEQGAKLCVRVLTNEASRKSVVDQSKGFVEYVMNSTAPSSDDVHHIYISTRIHSWNGWRPPLFL